MNDVSMERVPEEGKINNLGARIASIASTATDKMNDFYIQNSVKVSEKPIESQDSIEPASSIEDLEKRVNRLLDLDRKPTENEPLETVVPSVGDSGVSTQKSDMASLQEILGIPGFVLEDTTVSDKLFNGLSKDVLSAFSSSAQNLYNKIIGQFKQISDAIIADERSRRDELLKKASDQNAALKKENASLKDSLHLTETDLENEKNANSTLRDEVSRKDEEISLLSSQKLSLIDENKSLNNELSNGRVENAKLKNTISENETTIKELKESHERDISSLQDKYESDIAKLKGIIEQSTNLLSGNTIGAKKVTVEPQNDNPRIISLNEYKDLRNDVANVGESNKSHGEIKVEPQESEKQVEYKKVA